MSHDGKGLSAMYGRDLSKGGEKKRSRFDEGAPEEEEKASNRSERRETVLSESSSSSYKRHRDDERGDRREREDPRVSSSSRYRDDRSNRSDEYHRRSDDRGYERGSERYRDDDHRRNDRDSRDSRRDYKSRDSRDYRDSRDSRDYRRPSSSSTVEIPFDKFLRLSPWRGPVTALEERVRHLKNWDVAPAGFERIGADKAKLTGLFPPPGNIAKSANYVPPTLDPARAAMLQLLNKDNMNMREHSNDNNNNTNNSLSASLQKQAKRFYVGNLPPSISESSLMAFLESNLASLSGTGGSRARSAADPSLDNRVLSINISTDRSYAFVDCRTAEDASLAMNLDGVLLENSQLKVRRPKEYHVALTSGAISSSGTIESSSTMASKNYSGDNAVITDSSSPIACCINRRQLLISGIPDILTGEHIKALLLLVNELRSFLLLRDRKTDKSLGVAIFEFVEDSPDVESWTGPFLKHTKGKVFMGPFEMKLGRVIDLINDNVSDEEGDATPSEFDEVEKERLQSLLSLYNLQPGYATAPSSTTILQILNIVSPQTLQSDYAAIHADLSEELKKFSSEVQNFELTIPEYDAPGAGKVFVKFGRVEEAARAASEISGRIFDGHTCIVSFYPPEKYEKRIF